MSTALKIQNIEQWQIEAFKDLSIVNVALPTEAHERTTEQYCFTDSYRCAAYITTAAAVMGIKLYVKKTKKMRSKTGKGKHVIVFGTGLFIGADEITLTMVNSADGLSAQKLLLGILRALCDNGLLVVNSIIPSERIIHKGPMTYERVEQAVHKMLNRLQALKEFTERLQTTRLNSEQINALAKQALEIRGIKDVSPEFTTVDKVRRPEDADNTAWNVYNRIQENLTKGFTLIQGGKVKQVQALRSPVSDLNMNLKLADAVFKLVA